MNDTVLGVLPLTNFHSMEIIEIEFGIDDKVVYRYSNETKTHKAKIYNTIKTGRSYFKVKGVRYFLDEFMKVGGM